LDIKLLNIIDAQCNHEVYFLFICDWLHAIGFFPTVSWGCIFITDQRVYISGWLVFLLKAPKLF